MSQNYSYPSSSSVTVSAIGGNGGTNPSTSIQIGGKSPSSTLLPINVDSSGNLIVAPLTSSSVIKAQLQDNNGAAVVLGQTTMSLSLPVTIASNQSALAISAASLPLPAGASTSALQTSGNSSLSSIDNKTPALGQALAAASVPIVLTAAQLTTLTPLTSVTVTQATGTNLHTVVDSGSISVTSSALPTGGATSALQTSTQGTVAAGTAATASTLTGGVFNTALPTLTNGQQTATQLDSSGRQIIAPLASTSTVTVVQATGTNLHVVNDAGTAIMGKVGIDQTTVGTTNAVSIAQLGANTVLTGNGVSGTGSLRVNIASDNTAFNIKQNIGATSTITSVAGSATSVSLLVLNANRVGATFYNDSTAIAYLAFASTASTTAYTVQMVAGAYYELPFQNKMYTGIVSAIWASAAGSMRITELV